MPAPTGQQKCLNCCTCQHVPAQWAFSFIFFPHLAPCNFVNIPKINQVERLQFSHTGKDPAHITEAQLQGYITGLPWSDLIIAAILKMVQMSMRSWSGMKDEPNWNQKKCNGLQYYRSLNVPWFGKLRKMWNIFKTNAAKCWKISISVWVHIYEDLAHQGLELLFTVD